QYLYDSFVYDSPIEADNIQMGGLDKVEVFGKIPRSSIRIPMYFGGTTSPDFMYVIHDKDGNPALNLVIESKDVEKETDIRISETAKIEASKKFFEILQRE